MKVVLRGAVLGLVAVECPACELGLDMQKAEESIVVFAEAAQANCRQVMQVIRNLAGLALSVVSSYDDLWCFIRWSTITPVRAACTLR